MGETVSFKGNKDGIVLLLDCNIDFEVLCQTIVQKLWQSRSFLGEHTTLVVNSGDICLDSGQRLALKILLQSLGHEVKYFLPEESDGARTDEAKAKIRNIERVGTEPTTGTESKTKIATRTEAEQTRPVTKTEHASAASSGSVSGSVKEQAAGIQEELRDIEHYLSKGALAVRKNVRSGQKISYDGTLIIFGDVNAGAELVATGHILVLGALRGVAHAGCQGDKNAIVYATQLCSLQLRIAELIARAPDGESTDRRVPEIARIIDNYLVIEEV